MRFKTKQYAKLAVTSLIAVFSFGLAISCVSNHKQNINKVFAADDISTTWSYNSNNKALSCTYASNYPNGFVWETNQVSVTGRGGGQYELAYSVLGYPSGSVEPDLTDYGTFTLTFSGSYDSTASTDAPYGSITARPVDVSGLNSETEYEIYLKVEPTGDMNQQGSGGGDDGNGTVIYYDANYGFYYGTTERVELTVTKVDFTGSNNFVNGSATVYLIHDDYEYSTTMSNVSLEPVPSEPSGESYTGTIFGYIDESQCNVNYHPLESVILNYVVEPTPEPPALSALEWYFNEDMGYFSTNPYNDGYYSFSLNTNIVSVIYDRLNATVTANCTVETAEGNMPEEYYEAEISFVYTNAFGSVVEQVWYFNDAQCDTTIEDKENLHFSVDQVSFTKLGWYYEEDLRYYIEENVEASWNIDHCEYRKEGNRDEFVIYMDVMYNDEHIFPNFDAIQINRPDFDDSPYPGQTNIGTGVNGWCDRLQQYITISCISVPFAYYGNGWSYDDYNSTLVYISSEDIELEYELTSVDIDGEYYNLTYTAADGDSQTIVVSNASFNDEVLTGKVTLYNGGDSIDVSLNIPESIVDPGSAYDYGWTYEEENQKLVYYDPDYGVYTLVRGVNNVMDKVATLTYESPEGDNPSQTMTIDIDFSGGTGGYDYSANTVSGYARLQGESSTAEYITVLLKNKDGNTINVDGANTWAYDGAGILWINASSNAVPIDDLRGNMTGSTFYLAEDTSNQYCEIDYTYDGRVLPTLTINKATYEEHELDDNEGVEYIVSGIFERLDESSGSVTIPGEFWHPRSLIPDYVVSFDANGGQGQMEPESITAPSDGGSVSYPLPECQFTRDDYNFVGWATTSASADTIQPEETFDLSGDQTFYAIWSEVTREYTFNITFQDGDATGGSMEDVTITSTIYEYEYTLPTCGYEKEGYEFAGWIYLSSGTSKIYQPGDTCTLDCDVTNAFRATWTKGEFVTISFDANGGIGTMEALTVENGSTQTVPGCDFTYEGYDFVEWAVGSPSSSMTFKPGVSVTVTDDYTLYAIWEESSPSLQPTTECYWVYDDMELKWVDEAHPDYITVIDKVIVSEISEGNYNAAVVVNILTASEELVTTKYISLTSVQYQVYKEGFGSVQGYFNLLESEDKFIMLDGVSLSVVEIPTPEEKDEPISEEQKAQIQTLLPETESTRASEILDSGEISQGTASDIYLAVSETKSSIDEKRGSEGYTEEEYQKDLSTIQTITEAAVVVGAGAEVAEEKGQSINDALPADSGIVDMSQALDDFYQTQMNYLLGKEVVPDKKEPSKSHLRVMRAGESSDPGIDLNVEEYDLMIEFVDTSVENVEEAALAVRKCSGAPMKANINAYIEMVLGECFRDYDKEKADKEFVEQAHESIMLTMQQQVIEALEKDHKPSNDPQKEAEYQEQLEAVKDLDTFKEIVMEVLRLKYVSLTNEEIGIDSFREIYWNIFQAWALDDPSLNPYGITLEELTNATIETTTKKANRMTFTGQLQTEEIIFLSVVGGVTLAGVGAGIAVPMFLKKKKGVLAK